MRLDLKFCMAGLVLVAALAPGAVVAETVSVAVAANFTGAAKALATAFKKTSGDDLELSFGSTGTLYTQISQGAPFEVLLAADALRPAKAIRAGLAVGGSDFTYAVGQIVLFSTNPELVTGPDTLRDAHFAKLAIANPETAPYGAAAVETMKKLGVYDTLTPELVQGENIAQTYQFVATGNAELGFVALSQVMERHDGSRWVVPSADYTPIEQHGVLLETGKDSAGAKAFLKFLKGPVAGKIIAGFGYGTGSPK